METTAPPTTTDVTTERAAYTAGLRVLADILDANPRLPLPYDGTASPLMVFTRSREDVAAWARALPGTVTKHVTDSSTYGFELTGAVAGLEVKVFGERAQVCERVVTGTETVTRLVPDPAAPAVPLVPLVEVTETVETVRWECRPLLAEAAAPVLEEVPA